MSTAKLREVAKFASGLVMGDFICGLWLYAGGYLPITFLGITFGVQTVVGWLAFDALLFAALVHYAWRMDDRKRTKNEMSFHLVAGTIFTLVALLHISRIFFGWNLVVGDWTAPYWLNGLGTVIAAFLAYVSFHFASKQ